MVAGKLDRSVARRVPIGNGILTVDTDAQAWARARKEQGDKGGEAVRAALSLIRLKRRLDAGEKLILVDTREDSEWANGHMPGAIQLGKGVIERDIEQAVPDTKTKLILYCGGGFRSALAADNLQKMGYSNVESMDGGWKGWVSAGLPTAKG